MHVLEKVTSKVLPKNFTTKKSLLIKPRKTQARCRRQREKQSSEEGIFGLQSHYAMKVGNGIKYATLRKQYPEKTAIQVLTPKMSCPKDILQMVMGEAGPNWMERNEMEK